MSASDDGRDLVGSRPLAERRQVALELGARAACGEAFGLEDGQVNLTGQRRVDRDDGHGRSSLQPGACRLALSNQLLARHEAGHGGVRSSRAFRVFEVF
jgi:hypothetical protein